MTKLETQQNKKTTLEIILSNKYFDYDLEFMKKGVDPLTALIKEVYETPKIFQKNFVQFATTKNEEPICWFAGDNGNNLKKGEILLYGWVNFYEYYTYDFEGNMEEYHQDDVYDFTTLASSFGEFVDKLYDNKE